MFVGRGRYLPTYFQPGQPVLQPSNLPPYLLDADFIVVVVDQRFDADMWIHQGIRQRARYVDENILPGATELDVVGKGGVPT